MVQRVIGNIALSIFSIIFCMGMLCAFYTDLNFFLTKRIAQAKDLQIIDSSKPNRTTFQVDYFNHYLNRDISSFIILKAHDAFQLEKKKNNQILIYYAKNFPNKIYIENVNVPRYPILIFEAVMFFLMSFLAYTSIKILLKIGFWKRIKEKLKTKK